MLGQAVSEDIYNMAAVREDRISHSSGGVRPVFLHIDCECQYKKPSVKQALEIVNIACFFKSSLIGFVHVLISSICTMISAFGFNG